MHIQLSVTFCLFVLKVLNGNEILTSIKGHNSVTNNKKITDNNLNLDLVNTIEYIKFGEILSICSQDFERKLDSDVNQSVTNVRKMMCSNLDIDLVNF